MALEVKWTTAALDDLDGVAEYIARDSAHYAAGFVSRVRAIARTLGNMPEGAAMVPEFDDRMIREVFVRRYRLIYQIEGTAVHVLALIHGSRDLMAVWDETVRRPDGAL